MRSAPSVTSPVGRSRLEAALVGLICGLGLIDLAAWTLGPSSLGWRQALGGVVLALCAVWAWSHLRQSPQGQLAWDGMVWRWSTGGAACEVVPQVACDLQRWLLVQLHTPDQAPNHAPTAAPPRWLWLQAGVDTPHWLALRRALYSRGARQAPADGTSAPP